jgi:aspartate aminotransferase-like enzyme
MLHHRSPEFSAALASVLEMIRPLFGTQGNVLPVHTTGRGAMEAAIANLFSHGDEIVCCCNGKFGEMWAGLASTYGLVVHRVATSWNEGIDLAELSRSLDEHPDAVAVTAVFSDTSTGVRNDIAAIAREAGRRGALVLVDGISGIGGMPFEFDAWGVDVAVTGSQKCLMSGTGLAFAAVSPRAMEAARAGTLPRSYWDFRAILDSVSASRPQTPGSTPVHLMLQVEAALSMIHEEGLENVFARHEAMAAAVRGRIARLGLVQQCPGLPSHSATLTAIASPARVPPGVIRDGLKRRGILVGGGLGQFQEIAFRIGHLGDIRSADVERTLDALEVVLGELLASARAAPAQVTVA